jgi:cutinase
MKCLIPLSLLVASVVAAPTAAPAPAQAEGVSFPITDLIDSDLTFDEYAAQLEGQEAGEAALAKRQYNGDTFNQFTDGSA